MYLSIFFRLICSHTYYLSSSTLHALFHTCTIVIQLLTHTSKLFLQQDETRRPIALPERKVAADVMWLSVSIGRQTETTTNRHTTRPRSTFRRREHLQLVHEPPSRLFTHLTTNLIDIHDGVLRFLRSPGTSK